GALRRRVPLPPPQSRRFRGIIHQPRRAAYQRRAYRLAFGVPGNGTVGSTTHVSMESRNLLAGIQGFGEGSHGSCGSSAAGPAGLVTAAYLAIQVTSW